VVRIPRRLLPLVKVLETSPSQMAHASQRRLSRRHIGIGKSHPRSQSQTQTNTPKILSHSSIL
jgi:hypothetical protein